MSESTRSLQIIGTLGSAERPLEKAEQCIEKHNQQTMQKWTQNGNQHNKQHWTTDLIEVLCADEPVISNEKMEFIPKISMLPIDVQRNTLAFLVNHVAEIPSFALGNLMSVLQTAQVQEDEWCHFHTATLLDNSKRCLASREGTSEKIGISCRQKISTASQKSFDEVCKAVVDGGRNTCRTAGINRCKMQFDWLPDLVLQESATSSKSRDDRTKPHEEGSRKRTNESADEIVANKRPRLERRNESTIKSTDLSDEVLLDDLFPVASPEGGSAALQTTSGIMVPIVPEGPGMGITPTTGDVVQAENNGDQLKATCTSNHIDDTMKINVGLLNTELLSWSAGNTLSESAQETLKYILESNSEEGTLWDALGDIPLIGLVCICQFVVQTTGPAELSYRSALTMASKGFLKKLQEAVTTIPRALASTLVTFTKAFPKPTIEGVLLPFITSGCTGMVAAQFDLVAKLTKDVLIDEHTIYLLNGLLHSTDLQWVDLHTTLVQNILNNKLDLDQKSLTTLVTSLEHHGISQSTCKKFAKLLLFVINQYGKKMTVADVGRMQSLVTANKTFLKKAALNALKKLQPT